MKSYNQVKNGNVNVSFSESALGEVESSRMSAVSTHLTTFNAGDIIPIYCRDVLPDESISFDLDFVVRQTTLLTPTMGSMAIDFYAFFVPNRIVNSGFKAVMGENYNGSWANNGDVTLAPLKNSTVGTTTIPVGSIADYYGFPTQAPIPNSLLADCHDLKFRGYVMIFNEYFRDQNYQPPIPLRTMNVYNGFLDDNQSVYPVQSSVLGSVGTSTIPRTVKGNGDYLQGADIVYNIYGSGTPNGDLNVPAGNVFSSGSPDNHKFKAFNRPLKANKFHDYFTSTLPTPEKVLTPVIVPVRGGLSELPVTTAEHNIFTQNRYPIRFGVTGESTTGVEYPFGSLGIGSLGRLSADGSGEAVNWNDDLYPLNLETVTTYIEPDGNNNLSFDLNDLRTAASFQKMYEVLARGGSRYRELIRSFFGIDVDNPYDDIPSLLGHSRRELDLFQTAQTSATETGNSPQGNLAAFGYTTSHIHLFDRRFIEHGYVHVFAVVRHKNIYSSFFAKDNTRRNMLDYYNPELANISNQPVYTYEINPFSAHGIQPFGYGEAWAEYRFEPDVVSGYMRPGVEQSLSVWNYADPYIPDLVINNGSWLISNSEQVLNRTLALTSDAGVPQFKGQFKFTVDKTLPMPLFSVPGLDIM
ncbi:major capsid protein [Dipodfec virus UA23Rod_1125]|uniref:Major capsid protein n=1 Tax=Dipodfec virus UA23Rod_1125 TaxID=2929328 RepID=A0A976R859_9VIRU|nr:major capsid protein [Dipodfec virus UA23Rod_1125]